MKQKQCRGPCALSLPKEDPHHARSSPSESLAVPSPFSFTLLFFPPHGLCLSLLCREMGPLRLPYHTELCFFSGETKAPSAPLHAWLHALHADTCVGGSNFWMLSLPTSFARAIELSRQFPLTLSLCKFHNHMV